jgi:hypothetical protein
MPALLRNGENADVGNGMGWGLGKDRQKIGKD